MFGKADSFIYWEPILLLRRLRISSSIRFMMLETANGVIVVKIKLQMFLLLLLLRKYQSSDGELYYLQKWRIKFKSLAFLLL